MSMDLTAKDLPTIIDKALERYYDDVGGDIVDSDDDYWEKDGTRPSVSHEDRLRRGFNKNFDMEAFIDFLKEDVDFTSAIKERLDNSF